MSQTWATSHGLDLHLDRSLTRVRAGLESAVREAIRSGRLGPGVRLPSSRVMAADLHVARNTVAEVYTQLVAEGWLTSRHGSGTFVADRPEPAPGIRQRTHDTPPPLVHDLRAGRPDLSAFPRSAWAASYRRALSTAPGSTLGYTDPRGLPELRTALADYLARARGVRAHPDRVVICSGFAQGLDNLAHALHTVGAGAIAVEAYSHQRYRAIVTAAGLRTGAVPVDEHGADIRALTGCAHLSDSGAALLTPAHQFPTGAVLSPERRRSAVAWAHRTGAVLVEDDYDGEFRYDRHPVGALQGLAPDHVAYAGTASKSLAPGLRLGWLVVPDRLLDRVIGVREASGQLVSALDQLALADLISSGGYDHQIRRGRLRYRWRRDALSATIAGHAPQVRVDGVAAGLHAVLRLPSGTEERDVVAAAARRHLSVEGLAGYADPAGLGDRRQPPALVVGYGTPADHAFTAALARLVAALEDCQRRRQGARALTRAC
ncbi:MAG: GntR family transcriptional regulator / MocR family aminotransferase [Actinomycetota bacterium]|nr:GntR family transcriptional regulator / MocR family aminotransferase [Actinomycetota bacterium]